MFLSNLIVGLLIEVLVVLFFRGVKSNSAGLFCCFAVQSLSLPFNFLYNYLFGRERPWLEVWYKAP